MAVHQDIHSVKKRGRAQLKKRVSPTSVRSGEKCCATHRGHVKVKTNQGLLRKTLAWLSDSE